jgi:hypothetical protein
MSSIICVTYALPLLPEYKYYGISTVSAGNATFYFPCIAINSPCIDINSLYVYCINSLYVYCRIDVTALIVTESNFPSFAISAINVNSFNLSTFKEGGCKTLEKLVSIMRRKSDIIIITDCRLKGGVEKIRKILRIGRGCNMIFMQIAQGQRGGCA